MNVVFIVLLVVTFAIGVIVSYLVVRLFRKPIATILSQIVAEEIGGRGGGTLQSTVWMLLVFFVFALIAYVIVQGLDARRSTPPAEK